MRWWLVKFDKPWHPYQCFIINKIIIMNDLIILHVLDGVFVVYVVWHAYFVFRERILRR